MCSFYSKFRVVNVNSLIILFDQEVVQTVLARKLTMMKYDGVGSVNASFHWSLRSTLFVSWGRYDASVGLTADDMWDGLYLLLIMMTIEIERWSVNETSQVSKFWEHEWSSLFLVCLLPFDSETKVWSNNCILVWCIVMIPPTKQACNEIFLK